MKITKKLLSILKLSLFCLAALTLILTLPGITNDRAFVAKQEKELAKQVAAAKKKKKKSLAGDKKNKSGIKNKKYGQIIDITNINQSIRYPTACEMVSTVMILNFYGVNISVQDFISRYLPMSELKQGKNGTLIGESPNEYYIGSPYDLSGFGCYSPVIEKALKKALPKSLTSANITGTSLKDLESYIDAKTPALIWVTIGMRNPGKGTEWVLNGTNTKFSWKSGEHCMVLVGYDRENYYLNDPYNGNGVTTYDKRTVEKIYKAMGSQAVIIRKSSQKG